MLPSAHLTRVAKPLDAYVEAVLCELSRPDAVDLLPERGEGVDTAQLARGERAAGAHPGGRGLVGIRGVVGGRVQTAQGAAGRAAGVVQGKLHAAAGSSPVAEVAGRRDVAEVWAGLDLGWRRAILDALAVVYVLPVPRPQGRAPFNPETVRIEWKIN